MKSLTKENERLKKIVADLQLEKVILKKALIIYQDASFFQSKRSQKNVDTVSTTPTLKHTLADIKIRI